VLLSLSLRSVSDIINEYSNSGFRDIVCKNRPTAVKTLSHVTAVGVGKTSKPKVYSWVQPYKLQTFSDLSLTWSNSEAQVISSQQQTNKQTDGNSIHEHDATSSLVQPAQHPSGTAATEDQCRLVRFSSTPFSCLLLLSDTDSATPPDQ